jgi:hypothetical protein
MFKKCKHFFLLWGPKGAEVGRGFFKKEKEKRVFSYVGKVEADNMGHNNFAMDVVS